MVQRAPEPRRRVVGRTLLAVATLGFVSALASVGWGCKAKSSEPNLLLLIVDALRADHVHALGYSRETTPAIDALAERGVLFTDATSAANHTLASVPSILTSLYPGVHGVRSQDDKKIDTLPEGLTTLPEVLKTRGYVTAAFMPNPSLKRRFNFDQGFDLYDDDVMLEGASAETRSERFETATKINRSALAWLDRNPGKKFFAYLHYRDVHGPYVPPPPYHRLYWNGREAKANRTKLRRITREEYALMQGYMHLGDDHRVLEYYVSQYDGAISYTDEQIKVLLAELEKRGLLANTVLFLTADHGEAFLDHGTWAHGRGLYQEEVHVPLVLVDFRSKAAAGRRIDLPVQTLDIYPTILEMLKAPIPPGVQGVSLFDAIEGKEGSAKRAVFHQSRRQDAVRIGQWKAIHDFATKTMELYHLGKDPQEKQNLAQSEPEKAADLLAELGGFWNRNATHPAVSVAEEKELDSKTAEELKALGYIQ